MTQKITLKWQTTARPHSMNTMHDTVKRIHEKTNGRVTIEPYGVGGVVPEFDIFPGVQSGKIDIGYTVSGYGKSAGLLPHSSVGELPIWPSGQAGCAFVKAVLDKYVRSEMEALGVTPLFYEINFACDFGYFVPPYVTDLWCNKMYNSLEDVKGARIVSQCWTTGQALKAIGVIPVEIPYAEVPAALSNDTVDGALVASVIMFIDNCQDPLKCCVRIGFPQSEDAFTFMNKKIYDSLPANIQNIIIEEIGNYWRANNRWAIAKQSNAIKDERIKAGKLKIIELTPSEQAFCKQQWEENLVDVWVKKQVAAGFKNARAYVDDLKKIKADILASGIPQCEEEPLR